MVDKNDHDHAVPLVNGPLDGNSVTIKGVKLYNSLPMYFYGDFYIYELVIENYEDYSNVYYIYSNQNFKPTIVKGKQNDLA